MQNETSWHFLTWNLRMDNPNDEGNRFSDRLPLIRSAVKREQADVIGFQEVLPHMLRVLEEEFTDYVFIGRERDAQMVDECCCVAVRKETIRILDASTIWLSPTPEVPGSRYPEQSICPRVRTRLLLQHRESKALTWYINTHLDHFSGPSRQSAQDQLIREMEALKNNPQCGRVIWGGDLNYSPDDPLYLELVEAGFMELSEQAGGTFHNFGSDENPKKIDYLWGYQDHWQVVEEGRILDDREGNVWLSDHYPVSVVVTPLE